jgi:heme exporter protein C
MIWAKNTWGAYWTNDPKLNSAAIGMLIYLAYIVLRSSIEDEEKRARVSAVYNIFSFPIFVVLIFILPRLTASLHPGNGGNPGFNSYDLDSKLRLVFYPAVIGWTLIGYWIADLAIRKEIIKQKQIDNE